MKVLELFEDLSQKDKRSEFLEKLYQPNWKPVDGYKDLKKFIKAVADADPSPKGIYMQWIASRVIKDPEHNRTEDLQRLKGDLEKFEEFKSKLTIKDINQYKTYEDLFSAIEPFLKPRKLTADEKKEKAEQERIERAKEGIEDVYKGEEGWIKIPTTRDAACFLGQNTRWCTAGKTGDMFKHYNNTDRLFVIYDKEKKERFQLHINSGQFADEADRTKGMQAIPVWARKPIINWYKKDKGKAMSPKHIFTFAELGDQDAAKGTDHEEVIELMKKYGVV